MLQEGCGSRGAGWGRGTQRWCTARPGVTPASLRRTSGAPPSSTGALAEAGRAADPAAVPALPTDAALAVKPQTNRGSDCRGPTHI